MQVQVVLVFEHFMTVSADVVGGLGVQEDHVPLHVPFGVGNLSAEGALEGAYISTDEKLHDILACNMIRMYVFEFFRIFSKTVQQYD